MDDDHCQHRVRRYNDTDDLYDPAEDYCVHCDCHCTCLGCEYGPQDGMLMFPGGGAR